MAADGSRHGGVRPVVDETWLLILGELSCWLSFGLDKSDPGLISLGIAG